MKTKSVKNLKIAQLAAKPVTRTDLKFWISLYKDAEVKRQVYAAPLESEHEFWHYLKYNQKAFTIWKSGKRIGGFLLSEIAPFLGTFSIIIQKKYRGIGFGRKAIKLIETKAIEEGFKTLRADIYLDNLRSIALLEKCNFRKFIWLEKNLK